MPSAAIARLRARSDAPGELRRRPVRPVRQLEPGHAGTERTGERAGGQGAAAQVEAVRLSAAALEAELQRARVGRQQRQRGTGTGAQVGDRRGPARLPPALRAEHAPGRVGGRREPGTVGQGHELRDDIDADCRQHRSAAPRRAPAQHAAVAAGRRQRAAVAAPGHHIQTARIGRRRAALHIGRVEQLEAGRVQHVDPPSVVVADRDAAPVRRERHAKGPLAARRGRLGQFIEPARRDPVNPELAVVTRHQQAAVVAPAGADTVRTGAACQRRRMLAPVPHAHPVGAFERGRQPPPIGAEGQFRDRVRQSAEAPQQAAAGAVEQGHMQIAFPAKTGEAGGGDGRAIGRHRHRIQLAFVARPDRRAQHALEAAARELPHAHALVVARGHGPTPGGIGGDAPDHARVHARFDAQLRRRGRFGRQRRRARGEQHPCRQGQPPQPVPGQSCLRWIWRALHLASTSGKSGTPPGACVTGLWRPPVSCLTRSLTYRSSILCVMRPFFW